MFNVILSKVSMSLPDTRAQTLRLTMFSQVSLSGCARILTFPDRIFEDPVKNLTRVVSHFPPNVEGLFILAVN